ncbi:hypothetical protein [Cytobacillus sp. IB215665]|uniref:hypothetical protein n=1 Tax=Cytobacillus sp. IB215665 TaxID=3097357 RepID=UPI002A10D14B|nr:hypothetical protein [Cytobacillus sp. IB215665]MDX8367861.1 hypothetical protein [Cytobacillus sp. IB215665]
MATIDMSTYSYSLELDDKGFSDGLKKADDGMGKVESTGKKTGKALKVAGGAMAAGIGIAGAAITTLVGKTLDAASEINKFAQVTGMSTESFQEWDFVMKNFGYSAEQASGDLAALGEKAMDAANGVGEGAELFGMLGIQVTNTGGQLKSQEQIFNETITALQGMEDVTQRNAIASALLSTTGEELVPVLNMTAEELKNMKDNASIISEEDLKKAEEFKKGWEKAKDTLSKVFMTVGLQLMPVFQSLLDWVNDQVPAIQAFFEDAFNAIDAVITVVHDFFKDNILPIFQQTAEDVESIFPEVKAIFEDAFERIKEVIEVLWEFIKDNVLPIWKDMFDWVKSKIPTIKDTFSTAFEAIKRVVDKLWGFFKENLLPILESLYQMVSDRLPQIQSIFDSVFGVIKDVVEIVWGIFEDFLLPVLEALWDFVEPHFPLIASIIETAFDTVIIIAEGLISVFEGIVGVVKDAWDWLTRWNDEDVEDKNITVNTNYTSSGNGLPAYAKGTNFHPGGLALVGEEGPEIANLPRGTSIKTNKETMDMLGRGGGVTQNITINSPEPLTPNNIKRQTLQASRLLALELR